MAVQGQLYPENLAIPLRGLQQDWMVNNNPVSGFEPDFCFTFQEPLQQQRSLFLHQQQRSQTLGFDWNTAGASSSSSSSLSTGDSFLSMALSQSVDAQLAMQRQEFDCIIQLQSERLRSTLQEQRKRQLAILLKRVESRALSLMRQKEEDLAEATKRVIELETCLKKAQMERESWEKQARANEAMAIDLSNTIEQVRERLVLVSNEGHQDAESSCYGGGGEKNQIKKMACKRCNSRRSCFLLLPCRHLCSCKSCEAFLGSCPVCKSVKEASMEVFWV